jgi:D-alanyl-D-alanine carboxypeptidase (penicillin-binding protein 5/6)
MKRQGILGAGLLCLGVIGFISMLWAWEEPPMGSDRSSRPPTLREGSQGKWVEVLQRTLNARRGRDRAISVDGSFGPGTRARVIQFQTRRGLKATGIVDGQTWKALAPLVLEEPPVPPPSVVNARVLPKLPADPLEGPPFVTCKAWVIGEADSGKILASFNEKRRLPPASLTKILPAYAITRWIAGDPAILDEVVVFSKKADDTFGSSSRINAGEKVTVRELLYGLLLPSGNDAAIALAEHFGKRLQQKEGGAEKDQVKVFIHHLNQVAKELGMKETHLENPHGLTHARHLTSARDMLTLASSALKDPLFRKIVGTRQRGCAVIDGKGRSRNLLWKNTNELLKIRGYTGVKTGTTSAAGACLVACCQRDGVERIVVVLGASSSDCRYTETRNLFRWAWQHFPAKAGKPTP